VARTGDKRNAYRVLVEKSEAKRPHGRRGIAWKLTLNRIIKKWDSMMWAGFVWLKETWWTVVNTAMNIRVP